MFSFFKRKKTSSVTDINWLGVDIHSHLLPGIDDGAKDITESVEFIRRLHNLGYEKLYCTPHIFTELYPNTPQTIMPALDQVKAALKAERIDVEIGAAAEYMVDHDFHVQSGLLTLPNNHILIEMSYLNETPNIEQVIFDLQIKGYHVVLAHPERYNFYHKTHERYHRLRDMGCLFQLNLLSITGYYGKEVKATAKYLTEKSLYDLAGTDLHHFKHLDIIERQVRSGFINQELNGYEFKNKSLFFD